MAPPLSSRTMYLSMIISKWVAFCKRFHAAICSSPPEKSHFPPRHSERSAAEPKNPSFPRHCAARLPSPRHCAARLRFAPVSERSEAESKNPSFPPFKICAAGIKETRFIFAVGDGVHGVPHVSEHRQARGVGNAAPYDFGENDNVLCPGLLSLAIFVSCGILS